VHVGSRGKPGPLLHNTQRGFLDLDVFVGLRSDCFLGPVDMVNELVDRNSRLLFSFVPFHGDIDERGSVNFRSDFGKFSGGFPGVLIDDFEEFLGFLDPEQFHRDVDIER